MSADTIRVDLHIHTRHSYDSAAEPRAVMRRCREQGLGIVAVTDHNNIDGALAAREIADIPVIIGEEIKSSGGDIIGLFLTETIPAGRPPLETAQRIKAQGGLVGAPHPFDRVRPTALGRRALLEILPLLDYLEGYNAHTLLGADNRRGQRFAAEHSLPAVACSDAHSSLELGRTYTELPAAGLPALGMEPTPEQFLAAIQSTSAWHGRRPNPLLMLTPAYAILRKLLG